MHTVETELNRRILILDGAMGTMTQRYGLTEEDYRTEELHQHPVELKGNTDLLNLSRPDIVREIHTQYLHAGADIICTNTFGANAIAQSDYGTAHLVETINYQGARIAHEAADQVIQANPARPRFVAGAIGPTTKLASLSPDVNDPSYRAVHFDRLVAAYIEQAKALIRGGVDLFLLETITDTLNAKAALFALMQVFDELAQSYPIMVSGTITDASGRILSGQTIEAFLISISHAPILSVGLNCALGAAELRPYMQLLDRVSPLYVSTHPNAGLPNQFGGYDQAPETFASLLYEFAQQGWVNVAGGCCGTTPEHISALYSALQGIPPRRKTRQSPVTTDTVTRNLIDTWCQTESKAESPTYSLKELMPIISRVEDEACFLKLKSNFDRERRRYHLEQALLLDAHIFGRYQYLRVEKRLNRVAKAS